MEPNNQITTMGTKTKIQASFRRIRAFCAEFCDSSNIHGLRYLSERQLHWTERLLWLIVIGISLWMCGHLTRSIWTKWNDDPVTINIITKEIDISTLIFPTITMCPIRTPLKWQRNLSNIEIKRRNAWAHIWPRLLVPREFQDDFANESIYKTIQRVSSEYDLYGIVCNYKHYSECGDIFSPVISDKGLCTTFNALNNHDIYTDQMASGMMITNINGNVTNFKLDTDLMNPSEFPNKFPYNALRTGEHGSLASAHIAIGPNVAFNFQGITEGFYLMVTMPGETLATTRNFRRILFGETSRVIIKPKVTTTADALRVYDPIRRQCYFDSERQLRFFRIYTQFNCEEECLANFTAIECGCVPFYMPRDKNMAICGTARIEYYKLAAQKFRSDSKVKSFRDECNCLPTCTSIEFNFRTERIKDPSYLWELISNIPVTKPNYFARIMHQKMSTYVFYENPVDIVQRLSSYTYSDFFAYFGGLLGLFMGISALSIVELIYFFTLRLYLTFRPIRIAIFDTKFASIKRRIDNSKLAHWNLKWITKVFTDFSDNSNIHGVLYFTRQGLHWIERMWWIIAFGLSIWLCNLLIGNVWQQWQENPVKLSYSKVPIASVPFPTVTICPHIKFSTRKFDFDDFTDRAINLNQLDYASLLTKEYSMIKFEAIVHTFADFSSTFSYRANNGKFSANTSESIYETIQDIAPKMDEVLKECRWRGQLVNCSEYFVPILTEDGLCFAFNALNSHEIYTDQMALGMQIVNSNANASNWNPESGYKTQLIGPQYPFPLMDSLEVTLIRYNHDYIGLYKLVGVYYTGFKVAVTMPGDTAEFRNNPMQVQVTDSARITLSPKVTKTSDGLRKYDPNHRGCFFQSERGLRFFKSYTESNCEAECVANSTQDECACRIFSSPRSNETAICGIPKIRCNFIVNTAAQKNFYDESVPSKCNCLPACNTIDYNPTMDRVTFQEIRKNTFKSDVEQAKLTISFDNHQIEAVTQLEMYTVADFLSICGGLLGLFMGASVLSFIEILYFFTLRVFWSFRRERGGDGVIIIRPA